MTATICGDKLFRSGSLLSLPSGGVQGTVSEMKAEEFWISTETIQS
jgi:hypothetical protein